MASKARDIVEELRVRLREAEDALDAIRNGEVDAIIVNGAKGEKIFSLSTSDTPYRIILEEMDEGAIILDSGGNILYANPRFTTLISNSGNQITGSNLKNFVMPADRVKFSKLLDKVKNGRAKGVITFKVKNEDIHLNLSLRSVPEGISGDICIIASDVTNIRQNQILLRRLVRKRTIDLEKANEFLRNDIVIREQNEQQLRENEERLKELVATKDKFFNIVAHDLKNPFTSLLGSSELLLNRDTLMNPERISALASIFHDAAKNGYSILENLLDWSRAQTGLLKYTPDILNLKSLIEEHIMNMVHSINNKEIDFDSDIDENIFIFADKYMIKTVLRNLLSNAVKFTYRKGRINIYAIENDGQVIVSVKDTGMGLSPVNIGKIFRIDSKFSMPGTEREQGTGLGLKLCKEFIEKHGGKIWVESVEEKGSEFKFTVQVVKS